MRDEAEARSWMVLYSSLIKWLYEQQFHFEVSVQSLSRVWLFVTPWTAACQVSLSITNCWSLPKPMPIESAMPSNHLILCRPLLLLPSIFPSISVFSNESPLHIRWPKYWCFTFNITLSNEHPGLISFRMDWLDLLAVQGTLKSLFQHHSLKASILWWSAFLMVQFSHPYTTTGKTIALTIQSKDEYTDAKNWLIWKDPDAGKDWGQEEKGMTEDEMVGWHHPPTRWTWVWVSSGSWWWPGKPGVLQSMGSQRVRHN